MQGSQRARVVDPRGQALGLALAPGRSVHGDRANFTGLVLGRVEADFARTYPFESSRRDPHNTLLYPPRIQSENHEKRFWKASSWRKTKHRRRNKQTAAIQQSPGEVDKRIAQVSNLIFYSCFLKAQFGEDDKKDQQESPRRRRLQKTNQKSAEHLPTFAEHLPTSC